MPIKYFRQKRKVAINSVIVEKFIAKIQVEPKAGFELLAEIVEKKSSISRGDLLGVFAELEEAAVFLLENGHPLELDFFGSYYPVIEAKMVDTPEEVTTKTIKRFKVIFKPSKFLKERFKKVTFVLGDNKVRGVFYKKKK
jgi:predicted histone-like DNA-binding protein